MFGEYLEVYCDRIGPWQPETHRDQPEHPPMPGWAEEIHWEDVWPNAQKCARAPIDSHGGWIVTNLEGRAFTCPSCDAPLRCRSVHRGGTRMEDSEKPLKELFSEAIAKRKAREEAKRKATEEDVARWVPTALAATLAAARRSAEHGGGSSQVKEPAFSIPAEYRRRVWAQLLDQLAEVGAKEGFEIVPHGDRHYLVWDREAWDRKPPEAP